MVIMTSDQAAQIPSRVTIRELQRHASDVLSRVENGTVIHITKHGRTIARVLPPDPAEESVNRAIASGILAPEAVSSIYTNAEMAAEFAAPAASATPQSRSLSEVVLELREAEGDR